MSITNIAVESHTVSSYLAHILFDQNRRAECAADVRKGINPGVIEPWTCKSDFECWRASSRGGQLQGRPCGTREGAPAADGIEPKRGGLNV